MATMTKDGTNPFSRPFTPGWKVSGDQQDAGLKEFEIHTLPFMGRLYRTALILTGNPRLAKNLLHATFLQASNVYPFLHHDDDFGIWLFRMLFDAFGLNRHLAEPWQGDTFNQNANVKLFSDLWLAPSSNGVEKHKIALAYKHCTP